MGIESTDRELLQCLQADPAAFELFYRRHIDRVMRFTARRVGDPAEMADVVANTFLAVLTSAESYDPGRGEPTAWLLGITARLIANGARRGARESAVATRMAGRRLLHADDIERLEEQIDADHAAEAVIEAIGRLKPRAREALLLVGVEGLTATEASQLLGITAANFRMRLSAARRTLAKALHATSPVAAADNTHPHPPHSIDPPSIPKPMLKEVTL
jgi:RNA polymerase sigma factor (sigma-70 family)